MNITNQSGKEKNVGNVIVARKKYDFGKVDYTGTGRKAYPVSVEVELRKCGGEETFTVENGVKKYTGQKTPEYIEFSAVGYIWNTKHTDCVCGGQCLDEIYGFLKGNGNFQKIYKWWKAYHLNGMKAGTPEQQNAVSAYTKRNKYDYTAVCEYLKSIGLYEVPYFGKTVGKQYNGEIYRYGTGWCVEEIPKDVIDEMIDFLK